MKSSVELLLLAMLAAFGNCTWTKISGYTFTDLSGKGNELWAVSNQNAIYRHDLERSVWYQVAGLATKVGAAVDGYTFVVMTTGSFCRYNPYKSTWETLSLRKYAQINAINKDNAIMVTSEGDIYQWHYGYFIQLPGSATFAAIGYHSDRWIVTNGSPAWWDGSSFVVQSGSAVNVDVQDSRNVVITNSTGSMFRWSGSAWVELSGTAVRVTITYHYLFCVTASGEVYRELNDQSSYVYGPPGVPAGMQW